MFQTTLLKSLTVVVEGTKLKEIQSPGSTIGVQTYEIKKLNSLNKVDITIWDFAGQMEYSNNHQVFYFTCE